MPNILIVEDDTSIREAFSIVLSLAVDYDVMAAENGQVALGLCQENNYDLILLDIMMPIMDGPAFLKEYASMYPDDVTKIIIMSNLSSGSELSMLQDLGVERSVLKSSLTPQKLMTIVQEGLNENSRLKTQINDSSQGSENSEIDSDGDELPVNGSL